MIPNLPALGEIDEITREIHTLESHAMERAQNAIELKVAIGQRLIRAKEIMDHGEFGQWAKREFGWSRAWTARHMDLARNVKHALHLGPESSMRVALAALAEAKTEADSLDTQDPVKPVAYDVMVPTSDGMERIPCSRNFAELFMRWTGEEPIQIVERA